MEYSDIEDERDYDQELKDNNLSQKKTPPAIAKWINRVSRWKQNIIN